MRVVGCLLKFNSGVLTMEVNQQLCYMQRNHLSKVKRDKKIFEMYKSDTRVTRSKSKNTEKIDLSDTEIVRNSYITGEPAIPDIGHVQ